MYEERLLFLLLCQPDRCDKERRNSRLAGMCEVSSISAESGVNAVAVQTNGKRAQKKPK